MSRVPWCQRTGRRVGGSDGFRWPHGATRVTMPRDGGWCRLGELCLGSLPVTCGDGGDGGDVRRWAEMGGTCRTRYAVRSVRVLCGCEVHFQQPEHALQAAKSRKNTCWEGARKVDFEARAFYARLHAFSTQTNQSSRVENSR